MTMPKTYHPLVPLESQVDRQLQSDTNIWVQAYTKQKMTETDKGAYSYKITTRKKNGTLSVSYKASENDADILLHTTTRSKLEDEVAIVASNANKALLQNKSDNRFRPTKDIEVLLFNHENLHQYLKEYETTAGDFTKNNWLNTPGPIYTTQSVQLATGHVIASANIALTKHSQQIVFKQPLNKKEGEQTLLAIELDDFEGYHFDGNIHWNKANIINWWDKSEDIILEIIEAYKQELYLPQKASQLNQEDYQRPTPENFKYWLDFYQFGMKHYLEWYIQKLDNEQVTLPDLMFDWTIKEKIDKILYLKFLTKNND